MHFQRRSFAPSTLFPASLWSGSSIVESHSISKRYKIKCTLTFNNIEDILQQRSNNKMTINNENKYIFLQFSQNKHGTINQPNEQPTQASRLFRNQIKPQHKNGNNISKYISWNPDKWNEQSQHEPNCIGISQYLYNCDIRRTAFGSQKK